MNIHVKIQAGYMHSVFALNKSSIPPINAYYLIVYNSILFVRSNIYSSPCECVCMRVYMCVCVYTCVCVCVCAHALGMHG